MTPRGLLLETEMARVLSPIQAERQLRLLQPMSQRHITPTGDAELWGQILAPFTDL